MLPRRKRGNRPDRINEGGSKLPPTDGDDMAEFEHLTDEKLKYITNRLWEVESSLRGLSRLFQYKEDMGGVDFDTEEFFGIGQLLKVLAREISIQEDILKCGYDSTAITEESITKEIGKKKLEAGDYIEGALDNFEDEDGE